jgi:curved DNA-binding protein
MPVGHDLPDHYETLGLDRECSEADIRQAYRKLSRRHHPDTNGGTPESVTRTQALNAAHEVLRDAARRRAYDEDLLIAEDTARATTAASAPAPAATRRTGRRSTNITQQVPLKLEEFLRGTRLEIRVNDPACPEGPESYPVIVPPHTAPKSQIKVARDGINGGLIIVKLTLRPHPRFKARGADLRCDLRITSRRATSGGQEMVTGPDGSPLKVIVPARVARDEIIRLTGHGLPRPRGGRGDLLVKICYRPEVNVSRLPATPVTDADEDEDDVEIEPFPLLPLAPGRPRA